MAAALKSSKAVDSPVYTTLPGLQQPMLNAVAGAPAAAALAQPNPADTETYAAKFEFALEAKNAGDFDLAKKVLQQIYAEQTRPGPNGKAKPARPRVTQDGACNL